MCSRPCLSTHYPLLIVLTCVATVVSYARGVPDADDDLVPSPTSGPALGGGFSAGYGQLNADAGFVGLTSRTRLAVPFYRLAPTDRDAVSSLFLVDFSFTHDRRPASSSFRDVALRLTNLSVSLGFGRRYTALSRGRFAVGLEYAFGLRVQVSRSRIGEGRDDHTSTATTLAAGIGANLVAVYAFHPRWRAVLDALQVGGAFGTTFGSDTADTLFVEVDAVPT